MSYYRMHRGWMDNPIFGNEPFTRPQAWVWMIEHAMFADTKRLRRGELYETVRGLAKAWKWSPAAVQRYVAALGEQNMIKCIGDARGTTITICNYDKYQGDERITHATDTPVNENRYTTDTLTDTQTDTPNVLENNAQSLQPDTPADTHVKVNRYTTDTLTDTQYKESRKEERKKVDSKIRASPPQSARHAMEDEFEELWPLFPRKKGKGQAVKAFIAARKTTELDVIATGIREFARDSVGKEQQYLPYPATWLNGKRWLDQPELEMVNGGRIERKYDGRQAWAQQCLIDAVAARNRDRAGS